MYCYFDHGAFLLMRQSDRTRIMSRYEKGNREHPLKQVFLSSVIMQE
jgi:hypothetical protein